MSNPTSSEITQYLKTALDLHVSYYGQREAYSRQLGSINDAKKKLALVDPEEKHVLKPRKKVISEPVKPTPEFGKNNGLGIFCAILGCVVIAAGAMVWAIDDKVSFYTVFMFLLGGFFIWLKILDDIKAKQRDKLAEEKYLNKIKNYKMACKEAEEEYEKSMEEYLLECQKAKEAYNMAVAEEEMRVSTLRTNISNAEEALTPLVNSANETETTLNQLYAVGWIFPKYRNMVAISTMYEYFATGRCTELTGPDGAYNLYESELRQNLIIGKLDTIISNLDAIRENQYTLYTELVETKRIMFRISFDINKILSATNTIANNTESIAQSARINAYYAKITAQNTEALKYIALING